MKASDIFPALRVYRAPQEFTFIAFCTVACPWPLRWEPEGQAEAEQGALFGSPQSTIEIRRRHLHLGSGIHS